MLKSHRSLCVLFSRIGAGLCIYYYYYYYTMRVSHISFSWWSFIGVWVTASLRKSQQVSMTLLSIPVVLNNVVVWIVSTRPPIFKSSSPFNNPSVTVPRAPITIGMIITFMFQAATAKPTILQVFFFCWLLESLVFCLRLSDLFVFQSPIGAVCHSLGQMLGCVYTICSYG